MMVQILKSMGISYPKFEMSGSLDTSPALDGYTFRSLRGRGGQAEVWTASDSEGETVAVKIYDIRKFRSWKEYDLVKRQCRTLNNIRIPGVPRFRDFAEKDSKLYLVTDFVEGATLSELIESGHRATNEEAERTLYELLLILFRLHGEYPPVIHRDIKPSNIIFDQERGAHLIDFDAVDSDHSDGMTMIGTAGYMAPEVFQGKAQAASDIYALGATIFHFVTGRSPYEVENDGLMLRYKDYLPDTLSAKLRECLEYMLLPFPEERPSAEELLNFLNASRKADAMNKKIKLVRDTRAKNDKEGKVEYTSKVYYRREVFVAMPVIFTCMFAMVVAEEFVKDYDWQMVSGFLILVVWFAAIFYALPDKNSASDMNNKEE